MLEAEHFCEEDGKMRCVLPKNLHCCCHGENQLAKVTLLYSGWIKCWQDPHVSSHRMVIARVTVQSTSSSSVSMREICPPLLALEFDVRKLSRAIPVELQEGSICLIVLNGVLSRGRNEYLNNRLRTWYSRERLCVHARVPEGGQFLIPIGVMGSFVQGRPLQLNPWVQAYLSYLVCCSVKRATSVVQRWSPGRKDTGRKGPSGPYKSVWIFY
jgi:hypothetical protein